MRPDLRVCRDRLARRVLGQVGPIGLVAAPATSRVLESALLLALLTQEGLAPDGAESARRYLKTTLDLDPPDPLQCAFARAALGEAVAGDQTVRAALSGFEHFSTARKMLTFQTLLAELGAAEYPRDVPATAFQASNQQSWLRLQLSALKVMIAPAAVTDDDWTCLRPALRPGPVWEACHLARLVGLLALRRSPAHRQAVRETLVRVATEQLPGGGLPFVTGLDVFATAVAGTALARITPDHPQLAVMAGGLAAQQNPDGGFGFTVGVAQSDVDDTAYSIEFLRAVAAQRHADVILAAEEYLLAQRNTDGGFPTFWRGAPSEVAMTAGAVNALAPNPAHHHAVQDGVRYILDAGQIIERSWSRNATNVIFRTSLACATLPSHAPATLRSAAHAARQDGWRYLADTQAADGGWGHERGDASDPISTAYAVIALANAPDHTANLHRALDYLVTHQQPDGGYLSRPDQAGPRPLLYNIPALADISVLLALSACDG
jgi:squalene-hopene/tetraprenyl-beta-curcumene cyclase